MGVIVLTAGHSATDPGAVANGYTEAGLMVRLRDHVAEFLKDMGHVVIEDGGDGENLPLRHAIGLIDQGAIAVELHANASSNPGASGVEAISLPGQRDFCQRLSGAVAQCLGTRVRGDDGWIDQSQSARGRLGYVNAGGVILEAFFISNPDELGRFLEAGDDVAMAIANALHDEVTSA